MASEHRSRTLTKTRPGQTPNGFGTHNDTNRIWAFGSCTPRYFDYLDNIPQCLRIYNVKLPARHQDLHSRSLVDYMREARDQPHRTTGRDQSLDSSLARRVYAFGSSTPREFSHLDKLDHEWRIYDVRLKPINGDRRSRTTHSFTNTQKRSKTTDPARDRPKRPPRVAPPPKYERRTSSMSRIGQQQAAASAASTAGSTSKKSSDRKSERSSKCSSSTKAKTASTTETTTKKRSSSKRVTKSRTPAPAPAAASPTAVRRPVDQAFANAGLLDSGVVMDSSMNDSQMMATSDIVPCVVAHSNELQHEPLAVSKNTVEDVPEPKQEEVHIEPPTEAHVTNDQPPQAEEVSSQPDDNRSVPDSQPDDAQSRPDDTQSKPDDKESDTGSQPDDIHSKLDEPSLLDQVIDRAENVAEYVSQKVEHVVEQVNESTVDAHGTDGQPAQAEEVSSQPDDNRSVPDSQPDDAKSQPDESQSKEDDNRSVPDSHPEDAQSQPDESPSKPQDDQSEPDDQPADSQADEPSLLDKVIDKVEDVAEDISQKVEEVVPSLQNDGDQSKSDDDKSKPESEPDEIQSQANESQPEPTDKQSESGSQPGDVDSKLDDKQSETGSQPDDAQSQPDDIQSKPDDKQSDAGSQPDEDHSKPDEPSLLDQVIDKAEDLAEDVSQKMEHVVEQVKDDISGGDGDNGNEKPTEQPTVCSPTIQPATPEKELPEWAEQLQEEIVQKQHAEPVAASPHSASPTAEEPLAVQQVIPDGSIQPDDVATGVVQVPASPPAVATGVEKEAVEQRQDADEADDSGDERVASADQPTPPPTIDEPEITRVHITPDTAAEQQDEAVESDSAQQPDDSAQKEESSAAEDDTTTTTTTGIFGHISAAAQDMAEAVETAYDRVEDAVEETFGLDDDDDEEKKKEKDEERAPSPQPIQEEVEKVTLPADTLTTTKADSEADGSDRLSQNYSPVQSEEEADMVRAGSDGQQEQDQPLHDVVEEEEDVSSATQDDDTTVHELISIDPEPKIANCEMAESLPSPAADQVVERIVNDQVTEHSSHYQEVVHEAEPNGKSADEKPSEGLLDKIGGMMEDVKDSVEDAVDDLKEAVGIDDSDHEDQHPAAETASADSHKLRHEIVDESKL